MTEIPVVRIGDGVAIPILGLGIWQLLGTDYVDLRLVYWPPRRNGAPWAGALCRNRRLMARISPQGITVLAGCPQPGRAAGRRCWWRATVEADLVTMGRRETQGGPQ
jgi:hypothetical protein